MSIVCILLGFKCHCIFSDVNDLHSFVTIALHTSVEEGDLSSDRLSHLKVVGSGFGPLIYGLKDDTSFESFQQGCMKVWTAIKETENLPELLVRFCVVCWK
jgi:hypothetical protein